MQQEAGNGYWFVVAATALLVVAAYHLSSRHAYTESFQSATAAQQPQQPTVQGIPRQSDLLMYINSFTPTYQCEASTWCDSASSAKHFLLSDSIPSKISASDGLPMDKVIIRGPPAHTLSTKDVGHVMGSFTVAIWGRTRSLDALAESQIELFDVPAQTPSRFRIFLSKLPDASKVGINLLLGQALTPYTWTVDRKLVASSENSLMCWTYDKATTGVAFSINGTDMGKADGPSTISDITLGVSEVRVNRSANWSGNLVALMYYKVVLGADDTRSLYEHMKQQSNGFALTVQANQALQTRVDGLMVQVKNSASRVAELQAKLDETRLTCSAATGSPEAKKPTKWQIDRVEKSDWVMAEAPRTS